jgi:hypothetical protein
VDAIEVRADVRCDPDDIFAFLLDFPGYAQYSEYLRSVHADGDGGPGTVYRLEFAWWRVSYTAVARVTAVHPPRRIEWELERDLDARGHWSVVPPDGGEATPGDPPETEVRFRAEFDRSSASPGSVDLPSFVPLGTVIDRAASLAVDEAARVTARAVADLEGERREVDLRVVERPGA